MAVVADTLFLAAWVLFGVTASAVSWWTFRRPRHAARFWLAIVFAQLRLVGVRPQRENLPPLLQYISVPNDDKAAGVISHRGATSWQRVERIFRLMALLATLISFGSLLAWPVSFVVVGLLELLD